MLLSLFGKVLPSQACVTSIAALMGLERLDGRTGHTAYMAMW